MKVNPDRSGGYLDQICSLRRILAVRFDEIRINFLGEICSLYWDTREDRTLESRKKSSTTSATTTKALPPAPLSSLVVIETLCLIFFLQILQQTGYKTTTLPTENII